MGVAKKMLSVFMAALLSIAAFEAPALTPSDAYAAEAPTYGFSDVVGNEWFAIDEVLGYATDHGIISGYDDGRLGAYDNVTRGQVAVVLHRLAGEPEAQAEPFADVNYGVYYGPAINWARSVGVINGYWDEAAQAYRSFGPDDPVTREQLATMLANYAAQVANIVTETDESLLNAMPDAGEVDDWARESVGWALDAGLMSGVVEANSSYVRPLATAQRCAMAKMASVLHRDILPPEVNKGADPIIEYASGVVTAPAQNAFISEDGLTASVPTSALSGNVREGSVVAITDDGIEGTAILVNTVAVDSERTIISGTQPSIDQVYEKLQIEDIVEGSDASFTPCNGFEVVETEDESLSSTWDGTIDPGTYSKTLTLKHEGKLELFDDASITGSVTGMVEITLDPKIVYKFDFGGMQLNSAYFELSQKASVKGALDGDIQGRIKIGELGKGASISVYLVAKITGELAVEFQMTASQGFNYENGKFYRISKYADPSAQMDVEASAQFGPAIRASIGALGMDLFYAELSGGVKADPTIATHPNLLCVTVEAYLFTDFEYGFEADLTEILHLKETFSYELITKENSPFKKSWHWENWKLRGDKNSCTWKDKDDSGGTDSGGTDDHPGTDTTILESGTCGSCTWTVYSSGLLTIAPSNGIVGYLEDWTGLPPWTSASNPISSVLIKRGVRAETCHGFFFMMREMKTVNLSGLDTSRVADMSQMFFGCFALESVDVSHLDTSNVNTMNMMFNCCDNLKTADLSGIDTTKVDDIWHMFGGCLSLVTIYTSSDFAPNIDRTNEPVSVFGSCKQLVGGNGTTYSEDRIYSDYARVDAPGSPGYFTLKS